MMKKPILLLLMLLMVFFASAQKQKIDTLRLKLKNAKTDSMLFKAMFNLGNAYYYDAGNKDSVMILWQQSLSLAKKHNWAARQEGCYGSMANLYGDIGDYAEAMSFYYKALKIDEDLNDLGEIANVNGDIGATYQQKGDYKKALPYLLVARKGFAAFDLAHKSTAYVDNLANCYVNAGDCYMQLNQADSAQYYYNLAYTDCKKFNLTEVMPMAQLGLGRVAAQKGNQAAALQFFRQAVAGTKAMGVSSVFYMSKMLASTARLYHQYKQQDSAEYYAQKALALAINSKNPQDALDAGKLLYTWYDEDHNLPQAYKYFKIATAAKDSMYGQDKIKQLLSVDFNEKERQQELQTAQKEAQTRADNRLRTYILSGGLGVLLLLALIFWRNSNHRKRANVLLESRNAEIEKQKKNVELTLGELKNTQRQLIQSEKMASLGELTAGIAHEIQNPLNFVNNFSEVSAEMMDELDEELDKGDVDEAKAIAGDIKQNLEKIRHHGKRADGIVKGMLEHSRVSSGIKEPTDLNKLAEEYLRLAYQSFSAKDKSFNAGLVTHFEEKLPAVNVIPQDIGRVLLNVFNNAFYAVNQKAKTAGADYQPEVSIATAVADGHVLAVVKDNGNGIPDSIKEKIMQPFFTTKPTGEGTGLGLSLSYDIVVKGHGGTIDIDSVESEFSQFTISIPII